MANLAGQAEQTAVAINVVLKDMDKTKSLLAELARFSVTTPFTPQEVNASARALLSARVAAEDVGDTLQYLGDASAGANANLNEVVQIFNKIKNRGKATQEELNQFNEKSINLSVVLQKTLGKTGDEISKMVTAGEIKFPIVVEAFKSMTEEGGIFFGAMEKQSTTFLGLLSTLLGNLVAIGSTIGDRMLPVLKIFQNIVIKVFNAFMFADKITGGLVTTLTALAVAVGSAVIVSLSLVAVFKLLAVQAVALGITMNTVLVATGWGAVIVGIGLAIAGVVVVISRLVSWLKSLPAVQEAIAEATETMKAVWESLSRTWEAVKKIFMRVVNAIQGAFGVATENMSNTIGEFVGGAIKWFADMILFWAVMLEALVTGNDKAWTIVGLKIELTFRQFLKWIPIFGTIMDFVLNKLGRSISDISGELDSEVESFTKGMRKGADAVGDAKKGVDGLDGAEVGIKVKEFGFENLVKEFQKSQLGKDAAASTAANTASAAGSLTSMDIKMSKMVDLLGTGGGAVATA